MENVTDKILECISWFSTIGLTVISDITDVLSLIFILVSIICSIITTIVPKIRKAKEDGKITHDEVVDIADTIKQEVDKGKDVIDKASKNSESKGE